MDTEKKTFADKVRSTINWVLVSVLLGIVAIAAYQVKTGDNLLVKFLKPGQILVNGGLPGANNAIPADPDAEKACGKGAKTLEVREVGENQYALVGTLEALYPNKDGTTYFVKETVPVGTIGWLFQGKNTRDEYSKILAFDAAKASTNHECTDLGCPALFNTSLTLGNGDRNANYWTKDGSNKLYLKNEPLALYQAFKSWFLGTYDAAQTGKPLPRCIKIPAMKDMAEISSTDRAELEGTKGQVAKVDEGQKLPVVAKAALASAPATQVANVPSATQPAPQPTLGMQFVAPQIIATPYTQIQAGAAHLEFIAQQVNLLGAPAYVRADSCSGNQPNDWSKVLFVVPTRPDVYLEADLTGIYPNYLGQGCTSITLVSQSGLGYPVMDTAGNTHFSLTGFAAAPVNQQQAPVAQAVNPTPREPSWKPVSLSGLASEDWSAPLYVSQGGDRACTETGAFANPKAVYVSNGAQGYKVDLTGFSQYLILPHCEEVVFARNAPSVPYLELGNMYVSWLTKTPPTPMPTPTPNLVWTWQTFISQVIAPFPSDHPIWVSCGPINGSEATLSPMGLCDDWRFRSRVTINSTDLPQWDRTKSLIVKYGSPITGTTEVPGFSYWQYGPVK